MTRYTEDEAAQLKHEAERLTRAGYSRPDIFRQLNVPMHMLNRWALEGGWRAKDILAEQARARAEAMRQYIAERRARESHIAERFGAVSRGPLLEPVLETKSADPPSDDVGPDTYKRLEEISRAEGQCAPWARRQTQVMTPPWAPGIRDEDPEKCALLLAESLMRQGLLAEAERAMRFARRWAEQYPPAAERWNKELEDHLQMLEKYRLEAKVNDRTRAWLGERKAAAAAAAAREVGDAE